MQLSYTKNNRVSSGYSGYNVIKAAVEQYPWDEPFLPNGDWATSKNVLVNNNALQAIKESDVWLKTYRALSNANLTFHIIPGLDFKTSLGEDFSALEEHVYYTAKHPGGYPSKDNPQGGSLTDSRKFRSSVIWENTLSYGKKFNFGLGLNVVLGHSAQVDENSMALQRGIGFPSSSFDVNSVAAEISKANSSRTAYALQSFFGRVNLNYKDRYVGTLTMRADGSSKFASENRYGYFPSASLGWNADKESWWHADGITMKLRASIGATGNQGNIGPYAYQALASGGVNYNNTNGLGLSTPGNRDLKWETTVQQDLGIDMSFFKGALSFTADVFNKDTRDLLYSKPTMITTGYSSYTCNIGSMNNKGLELTIAGNAGKKDFRWRGDFNISFVRNKLTKLLDDSDIIMPDSFHALQVGKEVGSFYMVKMLGIYQHDEDVPEYLYENEGVRAGDGSYYILQRGSFAIRKMDSFGRVTTVKTSGAELKHPWQGAVAPSGELYFCNKSVNQLVKMDAAGVVKVVSGFTLDNPMGVKFDSDGFGYLSNRNGGQVIKFKDDAVVTTYSIPMPTCSAVDAAGRVVVGTEDSGYLYMIDKDGEIKQIAGEGNAKGSKGDGVPGDLLGKSTIGKVNGIWCAKDGALYFCDVTAQAVRKLTPGAGGDYSKGKLETIASGFWPSDVVVSEDCAKIFVTSATTHTIRLIEII